MARKQEKVDWQKRAEELEESWKRALADYKNLVRRTDEERVMVVRCANADLVLRLLPAVDLLSKAARHSGDRGVGMAVEQVQKVLREEGLDIIEPKKGEQFDGAGEECVEVVEGGEKGRVAEVVEVGYKWGDGMVLRAAKVKVYK